MNNQYVDPKSVNIRFDEAFERFSEVNWTTQHIKHRKFQQLIVTLAKMSISTSSISEKMVIEAIDLITYNDVVEFKSYFTTQLDFFLNYPSMLLSGSKMYMERVFLAAPLVKLITL